MPEPAGIQVLHVDDEPDFVELAAEMLEREDNRFSVETATSPSEGLNQLTANDFDCIVSDYQMPGQNGIEFLNGIREEYPDLPFILYTGRGSEEVASEAISEGVTDYLQKGSGSSQYTVLANRVANAVEQYRSRVELEETEENLSEIAEGTNEVLFLFNGDWSELLFVNSAYETVWGGSVSDLKANPQSFLNFVHPDDRENVRKYMERSSNGERAVIEYRIQPAEGDDVRWIRGEAQPILDDGTVVRIAGSATDITENKKRERELERTNDLFERAQEIADLGAWETDLRKDEGWWTEQVNTIYELPNGYEPEPGEGIEYFHPEDQPVIRNAFDRAKEAGESYDLELRVVAGEESKWVRTRGNPEFADGDVVRVRGTIQDITTQKEREAELQRERDRLEEFAGVVSHDLQNPLNVAEGRLELAQEECDSEHLDSIETALHRIDRITADVLWLAREGRDIGSLDEIVAQDAIEAAWNMVADRAKHAELHYADDVLSTAKITADDDRLRQLLENLFANAIEHGGQDVTVTVGAMDNGFYVEDDGPGIPDDRREEVFTAGYSTVEEGTGFGLSLVKQIAEAHDWKIHITESIEGGARLEITGVEWSAE